MARKKEIRIPKIMTTNSKEYFDMSLKASIKFFLQRVKQNSNLPLRFYTQSIDTTKLIINNTKYD